jgi:cobalt-zinc-cadmium efflux system membrane fusion protein
LVALRFWHPSGEPAPSAPGLSRSEPAVPGSDSDRLRLSAELQQAIGLRTERVGTGSFRERLEAPGRIAPDESRYAFITSRVSGVIRAVSAQIGQDVRAGDVLVVLDSPELAQARLRLISELQQFEIARTQFLWQESLLKATQELLALLKESRTPEQIHEALGDRPLGVNREKLISAYADLRVSRADYERNRSLKQNNAVATTIYQESQARYESASAVYQGLMDRMGFEATLALTQARQSWQEAETSLHVAMEQLRVLGVGETDDQLEWAARSLNESVSESSAPLPGLAPGEAFRAMFAKRKGTLSTYEIRAQFDGTILHRDLIVPGVTIDTKRELFTLANLSSVWVEAFVHESDFSRLAESQHADVEIRTRAYPGRLFPGTVIYTGDLVEEKTRMVKLLARAENPGRTLKPGMFVEVQISGRLQSDMTLVPDSAVLSEGETHFVYVRTAPEEFERRPVRAGQGSEGRIAIRDGLSPGEEVVVAGAHRLKAESQRRQGS